ncbi:hypothetical protein [Streptomyces sp. NPDC056169]|uniref:hypothetical protein n=1 Tax=Streptomyces sp. NPDC056169 TaxID=3345734 RepID=UPI0035D8554E
MDTTRQSRGEAQCDLDGQKRNGKAKRSPEVPAAGLCATGNPTGHKGLFRGGSWNLLGKQLTATVVLGLFSFVVTALIVKVNEATIR